MIYKIFCPTTNKFVGTGASKPYYISFMYRNYSSIAIERIADSKKGRVWTVKHWAEQTLSCLEKYFPGKFEIKEYNLSEE
jgi:hypothetical protein